MVLAYRFGVSILGLWGLEYHSQHCSMSVVVIVLIVTINWRAPRAGVRAVARTY